MSSSSLTSSLMALVTVAAAARSGTPEGTKALAHVAWRTLAYSCHSYEKSSFPCDLSFTPRTQRVEACTSSYIHTCTFLLHVQWMPQFLPPNLPLRHTVGFIDGNWNVSLTQWRSQQQLPPLLRANDGFRCTKQQPEVSSLHVSLGS